jgi:hypothetical protein
MEKRRLMTLIICIFLILPQAVSACWIYLTIDELVEKSDVILVGEVVDRLEGSLKTNDVNYNKWKVKVRYFIEGEIKDAEIVVGTPDERTSLHYDLNANGNQVLLFLRQEGSYYLPHSPQAVVNIAFDKEKVAGEKSISGEELLEWMDINNQYMSSEEQEELEQYLTTLELIKGADQIQSNPVVHKDIKTMGGFAFLGLVSMLFFVVRKR